MIQFNLLPDVKLEYVKAQRTKRMVISTAVAAMITTFAIFALLFITVYVVQKKNMNDLNADVAKYTDELKATPDLDKILTVQNQLSSINTLHDEKPVVSRMFQFVNQVTPADVTISQLNVDFALNTMTLTGAAPALDKVNTFVDTLKFATFSGQGGTTTKAFNDVVLAQFSRNDDAASYAISLAYNPAIFSSQQAVTLSVPKTTTTRSVVEQPSDVFKDTSTVNGSAR